MTRYECKKYLLYFMYNIVDNPKDEAFYKIYKTNDFEVALFMENDDLFPIHWLDTIFKKISKPKEFAFIAFFIDFLYGVSKLDVLHKSINSTDYINGLVDVQNENLFSGSVLWRCRDEISNHPEKTSSNASNSEQKRNQNKPIVLTFPTEARLTEVIENAFMSASDGEHTYSIKNLQKAFDILIPDVNVTIKSNSIIFFDSNGVQRDRFDVPQSISLN